MEITHAIILGVVEGLTEFLPVSSTGHLILASELLGIADSDFLKTFYIAIQLGAILSVVVMFWRTLLDLELLKKLCVAFIPTGILGVLLYPFIKSVLLGNAHIVVASLFIGGVLLIVFELFYKTAPSEELPVAEITYKQSVIVGLFQAIAMIPGVSRSAATIVGGLIVGIPRTTIVQFSFLLAVPTMAVATGYDVLKNLSLFTADTLGTLSVGFIVSFVVALLSMRLLIAFVRSHSFIPFGIYRIVVALVFFFVVL